MAEEWSLKQLQGILKILPNLEALMRQIDKDRKQYKQLVNDYYAEHSPFSPGRPSDQANFEKDINTYLQLVGHCIVVGDADILYEWGLNPLDKSHGTQLLSVPNMEAYQQVFEQRWKDSQSRRERLYMTILIDKFKALSMQSSSTR